ncbi:hypothetical protein ACR79M_15085 [Sphingobacterium spiritivorum]|uniref:hypothetical protein n=1 Tax=Sphingobacterium spiritivorum TaxID=258 RepID=UPI003DA1F32D
MRILIFCCLLVLITSCSIFRKTNTVVNTSSVRDSSMQISGSSDLSRVIRFNGTENLFILEAAGFRSIKINPDGSITATGENGKIKYSGSNKTQGYENETNLKKELSLNRSVKDSTAQHMTTQTENKATPNNAFNFWWVLVLGAVILLCWKIFTKGINPLNWLK